MNEWLPAGVGGRRLPAQLTSFVGREAELAEVRRLVRDHRLVTLTGAGGVGKTRLAVQLAGRLVEGFGAGAWWVDLAAITDADLVAVRVARTLGLPDQPGRSALDTLTRFIADRQLLVVLDNCEHLLDGCAALTATLLSSCSRLTVLATSREPIGVAGEVTWRTPSLGLADEAIELFTQRARLVRPDFVVTGDNAAVVAEICRRLDGVPLALELAAARLRALSADEIAEGLRDRFRLLTGGARTAVPRQQTLRASVDWSHGLLTASERLLFRRLAVFLGGFDLDAAHAVAGGPQSPRYQILDELTLLVDKSLVTADDQGRATRYRLLETVRQYALEKLGDSDESDIVRTRHRDYYTILFDAPMSADDRHRVASAEVEIDNLRAAFAWSRERGDIDLAARLASSLQPLWLTRGRILEGLSWFEAVLADGVAAAPAARACTLADKLILDHLAGDFGRAAQADEALAIARELGEPKLLARVLTACGVAYIFYPPVALPYFTEAVRNLRTSGDDWQLCWTLAWQADSSYTAGDPAAMRTAAEEGCGLAYALKDRELSRMCRWFLGMAQWLSADLAGAATQFHDLVIEAQAAHDPLWTVYGLFMLGKTLACQGDAGAARAAAQAAVEAAADLTGIQQALALGAEADAALAAGDAVAARAASDASWQACPQLHLLAVNGNPCGQAALAVGELGAARRWVDDAVALATGVHRMVLLATRIRVAVAQGDFDQAECDAHEALGIAMKDNAYLAIPDVLECLAGRTADGGALREAARLFGAAQAIRECTGQVRFKTYDTAHHAAVDALRAALGDRDFATEWADGAALPADEAVGYAQRGHGERRRLSSGWAALTATECDVVRLVGEGLGNKEIAARMFVSPRTVQTHLTHVYSKLGLTSRVQLAQEASRHAIRSRP